MQIIERQMMREGTMKMKSVKSYDCQSLKRVSRASALPPRTALLVPRSICSMTLCAQDIDSNSEEEDERRGWWLSLSPQPDNNYGAVSLRVELHSNDRPE